MERRSIYRRSSDRYNRDLEASFQLHLAETKTGFKRLSTVEDTVTTLDQRFDRVETRLNMILGGLAVVGIITPILVTLLSR